MDQAMKGNVYVSEPLVSKITGELSIMVAAPIYSGGSRGGPLGGVVVTEAALPLAHIGVDGGQLLQRPVGLRLLLDVLGGDGL